jgi:hypothetical protein
MGLFDKMFSGKADSEMTSTMETPECAHGTLVPRWDNVDDIGHEDRATHYLCEACGEEFSPYEANELRQTIAERLAPPTAEAA